MFKLTKRYCIGLLSVIFLIALLSPWLVYETALSNVIGRPSIGNTNFVSREDAAEIWLELKETGPIRMEIMTPYSYLFFLILDGPNSPGSRLAWYVARDYNANRLKDKRMIWWHLSGAAMTVWLTRNSTVEDLLTKANDIHQLKARAVSARSKHVD